ncbi:hypothetical protein [Desulfogranum mediterraneum]|uniref:hypothetical protein n=1 Tax=Desulfogranum mediterraneum TaxID=160661 RepID=UPI00040A015B|nr:hypothetical protein [Desulfogranum mediterraneum]
MNIFFYTVEQSQLYCDLYNRLRADLGTPEVLLLPPQDSFSSGNGLSLRSGDILILFAASSEGLQALLDEGDQLRDYRLVLILDDQQRELVGQSQGLSPRFLTFSDRDIAEVAGVVRGMYTAQPRDLPRYTYLHFTVNDDQESLKKAEPSLYDNICFKEEK